MELTLDPDVKRIIEECVKSGEFASAEEVVAAAVHRLHEQNRFGVLASGELNCLIAESDRSGPPIPYEKVRARLLALQDANLAGMH